MSDFIQCVKRAALEATEASKPMAVSFGKVISTSPLRIEIDQKLILEEAFLFLARHVTDHDVEMTVDHETVSAGGFGHGHSVTGSLGSGTAASHTEPDHSHKYEGKKTYRMHCGLREGEKVLLLRMQGGQSYIVWDRVG